MKKFNKLFLPLILITTSISASDKLYSFIGIQAGNSQIENESVSTVGVKYGKQSKDFRTSISYNYGENSNEEYQTLIVQVDTGLFSKNFKEIPIKPYIGASFGAMQQENRVTSKRDRGYLYGANIGVTYILNDALDFDLGYRYLQTSHLENIDNLSDVSLAMHYFY